MLTIMILCGFAVLLVLRAVGLVIAVLVVSTIQK